MLFAELDEEMVQRLVGSMRLKCVAAHTDVITEGESAEVDTFYIVESGVCEVFKQQLLVSATLALPLPFRNSRLRRIACCCGWMCAGALLDLADLGKRRARDEERALQSKNTPR